MSVQRAAAERCAQGTRDEEGERESGMKYNPPNNRVALPEERAQRAAVPGI